MAVINEESWRSLSQTENELLHCLGSNPLEEAKHLVQVLDSFRSAGQDIILQDFEVAKRNRVENRLWDIHGNINSQYRKHLRQFREAGGKNKAVEQRKLEKHFLEFIKSSQRFYRSFIQSLCSHFEGVEALKAVANKLTLSTLSAQESAPATGDLQHSLLLSCHQNLIRLGDLSRWREMQLETRSRNWGPAIGYYDLAKKIYPRSGASHNQLAVISLQDMDHLGAVYHLHLAIAVQEPHPNANDNLEIEFKKIEHIWSNSGLFVHENTGAGEGDVNAFVTPFLRLHAACYKGEESQERRELEDRTLNQLDYIPKGRVMHGFLSKMVLINVAAEHVAVYRLKNNANSTQAMQSFFFLQRLNVRMFRALLGTFQSELERHIRDEPSSSVGLDKAGFRKGPYIARQVLPALRLYSSWLMANTTTLKVNNGNEEFNEQMNELWKVYAETLTLIASTYSLGLLEAAKLRCVLYEDEMTLGFSMFMDESVRHRSCMGEDVFQKPGYHDNSSSVQRRHPNNEMLGRVRDLLIDGALMIHEREIPLVRDGRSKTFKFLGEDGRSEPRPAAHNPSPIAVVEDLTHVNETSFPQSAVIAVSSPIPMEVDTKRMVDDLVDSEAGSEQDAIDTLIERVTQPRKLESEDTSYGLIGFTTYMEHFGEPTFEGRRHSRPFLPSIEKSPFAPQTNEEQLLVSPRIPNWPITPVHSSRASPLLQQQSKYTAILPSNSSMPTPTFENSNPDWCPVSVQIQHPDIHTRNVQKTLDETCFRSSDVFPDSTSEPTRHG